MYTKQSKNTLILNILRILEKHTDYKHRLTQADIVKFLKNEFDMDVERKSITRNIDNLIEAGFEIGYDEKEKGKGRNKTVNRTNFYLEHDFDDSELKFLIDGIIFSRLLSQKQKRMLIKKLENLSSEHFKTSLNKVGISHNDKNKNEELFLNIEIIAEAIEKQKKVKYNYLTYDLDTRMVYTKTANNSIKEYLMSPYQMVGANGRYYVLCKTNTHEGISHIRIDRIKNAEITNEAIDKSDLLKDYSLPRHMVEHIYMMSGESEIVTFEFNEKRIKDVVDWFGEDIALKKSAKKGVIVATVKVNENAMRFWAMQYGEDVVVKSPKKIVDRIKSQLKDMVDRYK